MGDHRPAADDRGRRHRDHLGRHPLAPALHLLASRACAAWAASAATCSASGSCTTSTATPTTCSSAASSAPSSLGVYAARLQRHARSRCPASRGPCRRCCSPRSRACRTTGRRWPTPGCAPRASSAPSTVPALCGLVVVAPDFVTVVLGERWSDAIPVIQVLCWVGLLQSLQALNGDMLQALDRTTLLFRYSLFFFAVHMTAFVCGLPFGVLGRGGRLRDLLHDRRADLRYLTARAVGISRVDVLGGLFGVAQAAALMAPRGARGAGSGSSPSASARRCAWSPASSRAWPCTRWPPAGARPRCSPRCAQCVPAAAPPRPSRSRSSDPRRAPARRRGPRSRARSA